MEDYYKFFKDFTLKLLILNKYMIASKRSISLKVLWCFRILKSLVNLVKSCNSITTCKIRFQGEELKELEVQSGSRQRDSFTTLGEKVVSDMCCKWK